MPITTDDLERRLSGGASNTDPNESIGGAMSSTEVVHNTQNNLWDNISAAESAGNAKTWYRFEYITNTHATLTWQGPRAFIDQDNTNADTDIYIGKPSGAQGAEPTKLANDETAPTLSGGWVNPSDYTNGLTYSDVSASGKLGYWTRRRLLRSTTAHASNYRITVRGETSA